MKRLITAALLSICFLSYATICSAGAPDKSNALKTAAPSKKTAGAQKARETDSRKFTGWLIDSKCAGEHKDSLATYVKNHTRECMKKNGKCRYSLYIPEQNKAVPILMEMGCSFQTYIDHFEGELKIEITGYMKGDSIYSQQFQAVE